MLRRILAWISTAAGITRIVKHSTSRSRARGRRLAGAAYLRFLLPGLPFGLAAVGAIAAAALERIVLPWPVVRWDLLTGSLDDAIAHRRALGRHPVLVVEDWEKPVLRERFPNGPTASLDWSPRAEAGRPTRVGVWDPADRVHSGRAAPPDRLP